MIGVNDLGQSPNLNALAAQGATELFHGVRGVSDGPLPESESAQYMVERFEISGAMVARVAEVVLIEDESPLGYTFAEDPPSDLATAEELGTWVQGYCHGVLDELIAEDPNVAAQARRWLHLFRASASKKAIPPAVTRRENIRFDGATSEPYWWLGIASIAAKYIGLEITPEQALPYVLSKLGIMQKSARQDVSPQEVRGAIFEAASAFGEMHSPGNPLDRDWRYSVVRDFVKYKTGHLLVAKRFGNLYRIAADPVTGVKVEERPEGFGIIKPKRAHPVDCAASLRLKDPQTGIPIGQSALFRLLRAGIQSLEQRDLLKEALALPRNDDTGQVAEMLTERLQNGGYWPEERTIVIVRR